MNTNPEKASSWKGRLLLYYHTQETSFPVFMKKEFIPDEKQIKKIIDFKEEYEIKG